VSSVVVTPMRIIGVGVAAAPPPAPGPNDYPTPLEVPAGRRSAPPLPAPPADDEEDEEAVPLRRLSTPPPAPDEPQAAAEPAGSEEDLPPLGAPPPPAPSRDPNGELVPPTRPSAAPAPAPVPTAGASAAGPAPAGSAPAGPSPGAVLAPPPPAAVAAVVDVDVDVAVVSEPLESLDDSDLTEVPSLDASKQRRLPPPPPLRSSFTEGGAEDAKKKPWWEEFFQEDFGLSTPEPAPEQLAIELDFIQQTLAAERGAQILDVGSGNGHHAVALARAGYSVVGIDTSTAMLTRANSRARAASQPVEFVLQDMRELAFDQRFDAVLCWNSTFGYFEREKNHAVLRGIHQALKPGGHFLLDVPNRDFIIDQEPSQNWFECEGCVCMDDMRLDYITSRLVVKRTIMLDDGRNRECHYSMRVFSLHELGRLLHEIGFRVLQVSGSLTTPGIYLGSTSPRLIVLVTRP
jgi:SAM-dependent methyltransferase